MQKVGLRPHIFRTICILHCMLSTVQISTGSCDIYNGVNKIGHKKCWQKLDFSKRSGGRKKTHKFKKLRKHFFKGQASVLMQTQEKKKMIWVITVECHIVSVLP